MSKVITSSVLLIVLLFSLSVNAQPNFSGKAYDIKSDELVYTEHHTFSETDQGRTLRSRYLDPNGVEIASRLVTYADNAVDSLPTNSRFYWLF